MSLKANTTHASPKNILPALKNKSKPVLITGDDSDDDSDDDDEDEDEYAVLEKTHVHFVVPETVTQKEKKPASHNNA